MADDNSTDAQGDLLTFITNAFLNSDDFNGIHYNRLPPRLLVEIGPLLEAGLIYANFGQRMANPFILGLTPEPPDIHLDVIANIDREIGDAVFYPTQSHLEGVVPQSLYASAPYSRALVLGNGQLEHRFFETAVLARYRDDPRYEYIFDIDGTILRTDVEDGAYLKTMSVGHRATDGFVVVGVFLRYLSDLAPAEQQFWQSHEIADPENYRLHPEFISTHLLAKFPEKLSPYVAFLEEMALVNRMCNAVGFPRLFRQVYESGSKAKEPGVRERRPREFGHLVRPTRKELREFTAILDKMLSDNMQVEFFQGQVEKMTVEVPGLGGAVVTHMKRSLALLKEWLGLVIVHDPDGLAEFAYKTVKDIRDSRNPDAHSIRDNEYDEALYEVQRKLIFDAYVAVRTIRQALECHPRARVVNVPRRLASMDVWRI